MAPVRDRQDVAVELLDEEISVHEVPLFVDNSTQKLSYDEPSKSNSKRVCILEPVLVAERLTSLSNAASALLL